MISLTWRQHRAQLLTAAALITLLSGYLLFTGHQMASYMAGIGLNTCLSSHGQCDVLAQAFLSRFNSTSNNMFSLLDLVPLLAGLFWGAPLIARDRCIRTSHRFQCHGERLPNLQRRRDGRADQLPRCQRFPVLRYLPTRQPVLANTRH